MGTENGKAVLKLSACRVGVAIEGIAKSDIVAVVFAFNAEYRLVTEGSNRQQINRKNCNP